ncbi:multicopper oxidase family protein [Variovorax sp. YR216]|uniref:multicopper oxidase family protein n=1 Tax=Variovorax sp. YR216 TaxID=1882828 RepID=UPI00089C3CF2|nr:copper oxidase [Variovorax sp. YR216]SEB25652.1 Multicopper oxidase with three cupredoxin domains (includes cell division protein FtsP and spore coat protein CotA) [Variovorax sp. YR216]
MSNRRHFFRAAGAVALGATAVSRVSAAALPEAAVQSAASTLPPPPPPSGRPFNPVVTLNGWSLPWRMRNGVKEFHLVCEPVVREFAPGMKVNMWGFNGSSPGPTIEAVEGDRVRIFVTNKLPEPTAIHWHGVLVPSGMDGVSGLTQPPIPVGKTFVYEFTLLRSGSHFYHTHLDEQLQLALGMYGCLVVHPKDPDSMKVDRDFMFMLASYDVEPGAMTPKVSTMTEFNMWTWNNRVFPGIDPLVARTGDRVRIRVGNLTMTNHPIHMHGPHFEVTGTDGGWVPKAARWPEVTTDIGVGQLRAFEFDAIAGDWAIHCHKSHHTMNAMGHDVPTMVGVDQKGLAERITKLVPDYMVMGDKGMHDMADMEMPLPDNTLPMMTGSGPFGPVAMGGMFSVVKVRDNVRPGDYKDPGKYRHPPGTVAHEWRGEVPSPMRSKVDTPAASNLQVRRPNGHEGH